MKRIFQDIEAKLDYAIDWDNFLESGESIASQTVAIPGTTVTSISVNQSRVLFWVESLSEGSFLGSCKITTSAGRENRYSFFVDVGVNYLPA